MKNKIIVLLVLHTITFVFSATVKAQCAMCLMAAESGAQAGNTQTLGINQGILYLAVFPYLALSIIGYLFWKGYKKRKAEEADLANP